MKKKITFKLRDYLLKTGVTVYQMDKDLNISHTTLYRLNKNTMRTVKIDVLEDIINYLGCDLADIMEITEVNDEEEDNESETQTQED